MASEIKQSSLNQTYSDRFLFTANLPEALRDLHSNYVQLSQSVGISRDAIDFTLIGVNVPSLNTKSEHYAYGGSGVYVSSHTRSPYDPLTIKFQVDNKYANYYTIYSWLNFIYDGRKGYFDAEHLADSHHIKDYQANISIAALDNYNNPVIQWVFTHAFPTNLSSLDFNYQETRAIECTATFVFSQMFLRHVSLEKLQIESRRQGK